VLGGSYQQGWDDCLDAIKFIAGESASVGK